MPHLSCLRGSPSSNGSTTPLIDRPCSRLTFPCPLTPFPAQAASWRMSSTRGLPFTTSSADLAPWTADLNALLRTVRAGLPSHLFIVRCSHLTGLGVFVRDG
jgi:hypothetical protein